MATKLWEIPVPSTALIHGPALTTGPGREVAIAMTYETPGSDGKTTRVVAFRGVEAFRVTYYRARSDSMLDAYDALVDLGPTAWLAEVCANLAKHAADAAGLAHLMLNFDDGPCYEVLCRSHVVATTERAQDAAQK